MKTLIPSAGHAGHKTHDRSRKGESSQATILSKDFISPLAQYTKYSRIIAVAGILVAFALEALYFIFKGNTLTLGRSTQTHIDGDPRLHPYDLDTPYCNIEKLAIIDEDDFIQRILSKELPVVIDLRNRTRNQGFQRLTTEHNMLDRYGASRVILSASNSYSHARVESTLAQYVQSLGDGVDKKLSNETYYFFGDNFHEPWHSLLTTYELPPYGISSTAALSFGIGDRGSGVAFHFHGPGFSEVMHGRKRWFLYPFNKPVEFDPDETTWTWLNTKYQLLPEAEKPYECTIEPGEVLWFPNRWHHATLNLDRYTVFMSAFVEQPSTWSSR